MANTPTTTMRLDPELKDQAMKVLEPLGLNMTGAVTIFLKAVVRENGMPFQLKAQPRGEAWPYFAYHVPSFGAIMTSRRRQGGKSAEAWTGSGCHYEHIGAIGGSLDGH